MRLSTIPGDSGYHLQACFGKVIFNGDIVEDAYTADEEEGAIYRYKRGPDGKLLHDAGGNLVCEVLSGDVKILLEGCRQAHNRAEIRKLGRGRIF